MDELPFLYSVLSETEVPFCFLLIPTNVKAEVFLTLHVPIIA